MVLLAWLGCGVPPPPPSLVQGVQVVAVTSSPPNPAELDPIGLDIWVADALGAGADVLVWSCTPVFGVCLESQAPGSAGLPLTMWTATGTVRDHHVSVRTSWPTFHGVALRFAETLLADPEVQALYPEAVEALDADPTLLVWALACAPGECPIIDDVRANPIGGSDAWKRVASQLADPARLLEGVPEHHASIAVKTVPIWEPLDPFDPDFDPTQPLSPNNAPELSWMPPGDLPFTASVASRMWGFGDSSPDPPVEPGPQLINDVSWFDRDGDSVSFQVFTTEGAVDLSEPASGVVRIAQRPTPYGPPGPAFLVGVDSRGGTAVWIGGGGVAGSVCGDQVVLEAFDDVRPRPLRDWDTLEIAPDSLTVGARISGIEGQVLFQATLLDEDGNELGVAGRFLDVFGCRSDRAFMELFWTRTPTCAWGGKVATFRMTATGAAEVSTEIPVVLTLSPTAACAQ
ncbi:MAG: hypothetical protein H6735_06845 [Alphaproteobacteria bacterium]|nr:hypothetical protein [Alphaproteobacteria bacterium]